MSGQRVYVVTGASFGDEGKGLVTDVLCAAGDKACLYSCLVVRHNGGAQAGHTVECGGKRFVFHQLSSGSFRHADTYWAETFLPDLFVLNREAWAFEETAGFLPKIFADPAAGVTIVDDVILNMIQETLRGKDRHGSCGMGIYEASLRGKSGFRLPLGRVKAMSAEMLTAELKRIRQDYIIPRIERLGIQKSETGEYGELLDNENVLMNAAEGMLRGAEAVEPADPETILFSREIIVFEGAQGLLLDSENERFAPHVTASRTGLVNPLMLCERYGISPDRVFYVMRSYVTRHGAGELPCECGREELGDIFPDRTNIENWWQGRLRYGFYPSAGELAAQILEDLGSWPGKVSLFVTHLNETAGMVRFIDGDIPAEKLSEHPAFRGRIDSVICSWSPVS